MKHRLKRLGMLGKCVGVIYPGKMEIYLRILNRGVMLSALWITKITLEWTADGMSHIKPKFSVVLRVGQNF